MSKVLLLILDGLAFGVPNGYNAVHMARTPNLDRLLATRPNASLACHGRAVGLPAEQMGNSEVGHMTIGSGRVIKQELARINDACHDGTLNTHGVLQQMMQSGRDIHVVGLFSSGGVHSHQDHILHIMELLHAGKQASADVYLHVISDGRDVPPQSLLKDLANCQWPVATLAGRFYAMDRDNRWERTSLYLEALAGESERVYNDLQNYIHDEYQAGRMDEFIMPARFASFAGIKPDDMVLLVNFRADRMRQLAAALVGKAPQYLLACHQLVTCTEYQRDLPALVLFPPQFITETLGEVVANAGLSQMRLAETEKYPHVTYFFNAGKEELLVGEDRVMVPSPKVATYDLQPQMSLPEVVQKLQSGIEKGYDLLVVNFANCDMVGHSGIMESAVLAVEAVDQALGYILPIAVQHGYDILITADHGNAEEMFDVVTNQPITSHTCNPVPIIYCGQRSAKLRDGQLSDIAPTVLHLLGLPVPSAMTGSSLL